MFSVIGNGDTDGERVVLRCWEPGQSSPTKSELGLSWPRGIYSLSHVALPFPGNDPLYGGDQPLESPGIQFGRPSLQGEKGVIHIPAADLLRMRWNPFYSYLEQRIVDRLKLGEQETEN